jgi:isopentenyl-diphosphate delta-isomerase
MEPQVILVDEQDIPIGLAGKTVAHRMGLLHRALSVVIRNPQGEWLLQQRADAKYHSPGLWTNTCCSHPLSGEESLAAAHRRLKEEMGFDCDIKHEFQFIYRADFDNGLTEHELDHVFTGTWQGTPRPDPNEVKAWRWVHPKALREEIEQNSHHFTFWFPIIVQTLLAKR